MAPSTKLYFEGTLMSIHAMRSSICVLSAFFFVGTAKPAFGWGDKGHITVATIAEAHLNQAAKKGVRDLLDSQRLSDPRTATWADHIRPLASFKKTFPHNDKWHFIDTPYMQEKVDLDRDGINGDNVVSKVGDFKKMLADTTVAKEQRRDALLFVIHFVGDMHQPLHCIDRDDRGGNEIKISINGSHQRESNLHSFWDTTAVEMLMNQVDVPDFSGRLDAMITGAMKTKWEAGSPLDWAQESHALGITNGYTLGGRELPKDKVVELDANYIDTAKKTVQEQLQKAGIRLAKTLNDTFAP